jgi:hypothetical protein
VGYHYLVNLQIVPRLNSWFRFYLIVHYAITEYGKTEVDSLVRCGAAAMTKRLQLIRMGGITEH